MGDDLITAADAVLDRAFTLAAPPEQVWPWLSQLGKQRAGWYLPRSIERFIPPRRRALRTIDPRWQNLRVADVIPDYGGRHETFQVAHLDPPHALVYTSQRGRMQVSWSLTLTPIPAGLDATIRHTRLHLRLRLGPIRRRWLVVTGGDLLDVLTVAGLAAGLGERLQGPA
ncbi:MAG: SRPBCC family protein [Jatrophihabitans sp.]